MKVWSIVSQKGGSGKTTLALHLAIAAAERGRKTIVIDLDPQESAERWAEIRDQDEPAIVAGLPDKLDAMLQAAAGQGADLAIVDTPAKVDRTALIAAKAADIVLIPSRGTILDLPAIGDTVNLLKLADRDRKAVIVLNAMPAKAAQAAEIQEAAEHYGLDVIPARMTERAAYSGSLKEGQGVTEADAKGKAAREILDVYERLCERDGTAPPRKSKRARP
jgi:chromosome partitioning protein